MKAPAGNRSERLSFDEPQLGRNLNFENIYRNSAPADMRLGILNTIYVVFNVVKFL